MDQQTLEEHLKNYRYHLTRSLVELPQFSSEDKIKKNFKEFLRRLHVEYKRAQRILVSDYLEIDNDQAVARGYCISRVQCEASDAGKLTVLTFEQGIEL